MWTLQTLRRPLDWTSLGRDRGAERSPSPPPAHRSRNPRERVPGGTLPGSQRALPGWHLRSPGPQRSALSLDSASNFASLSLRGFRGSQERCLLPFRPRVTLESHAFCAFLDSPEAAMLPDSPTRSALSKIVICNASRRPCVLRLTVTTCDATRQSHAFCAFGSHELFASKQLHTVRPPQPQTVMPRDGHTLRCLPHDGRKILIQKIGFLD